jgi:transcriptional regulator with XRE-family HTH domain
MEQPESEARAGADSIAQAIGGRVRQGRNSRGWTLDQLAERSGVSRRMLVSIEHGAANPSIATLLRISDTLGIGLPALVEMDRPPRLRVSRAGTAPVLWRGKLGGQAVLVAGTQPPDVTELWDWTLGPAESHSSQAHTAGTRELLFVLDGQLELRVGQHADVLAEGDSASFAGDLAHEYVNASSAQVARFALTVFEPAVGGVPSDDDSRAARPGLG